MAISRKESKRDKDRAYRIKKKLNRGKPVPKKDSNWVAEYDRRVIKRRIAREERQVILRRLTKQINKQRVPGRTPTKKALAAYTNAFKRFLGWYGIDIINISPKPYGSGIIVSAAVNKVGTGNIDTELDYPFDLVAKSLNEYIANVRVKLVSSGRLFRWKSLAPLRPVDEVFIRAGIGLVKWARMMFPSSSEYREEEIVMFDSYFRRETPEPEGA